MVVPFFSNVNEIILVSPIATSCPSRFLYIIGIDSSIFLAMSMEFQAIWVYFPTSNGCTTIPIHTLTDTIHCSFPVGTFRSSGATDSNFLEATHTPSAYNPYTITFHHYIIMTHPTHLDHEIHHIIMDRYDYYTTTHHILHTCNNATPNSIHIHNLKHRHTITHCNDFHNHDLTHLLTLPYIICLIYVYILVLITAV